MNWKTIITSAALFAFAAVAAPARADHSSGYEVRDNAAYDYARVVDVDPIITYVNVRRPHRECWDEIVYEEAPRRRYSTAGPTVVGGIVGGVIGRQFGSGRGRDAMTVVGTLVGSAIGHDAAVRRYEREQVEVVSRSVERCRTSYSYDREERIEGYRVTYQYRGRTFTTRTDSHPGDRIRVRVSVIPVGASAERDA